VALLATCARGAHVECLAGCHLIVAHISQALLLDGLQPEWHSLLTSPVLQFSMSSGTLQACIPFQLLSQHCRRKPLSQAACSAPKLSAVLNLAYTVVVAQEERVDYPQQVPCSSLEPSLQMPMCCLLALLLLPLGELLACAYRPERCG